MLYKLYDKRETRIKSGGEKVNLKSRKTEMKFHSCVNIMNVLIDALGTSASFTFPMTRNSNKFQYLAWKYRRDIMIK